MQEEPKKERDLGLKGWLSGPGFKKRGSSPPVVLNQRRIAVLPFNNTSPDPADEYFADGMTEEMISTLSRLVDAEVISRTSVIQYKKSPKPAREISKELEVGTILHGNVRKAGNKLRISVSLVDAARDHNLWAESYDREMQDVFAIQSDIARKVAEALRARIRKGGADALEESRNVEIYTMYLRGTQLYHENTEPSLREAVALFEKIISREPKFVRAYIGLSYARSGLANGYDDFTLSVQKAETAAQKALELEPDSAEAHVAMANVHIFLDRLEEVTAEVEKAIKINPNLAEAYRSLGWVQASMGKLDAGLVDLQKAYRLDPMSFRPGTELTLVLQLAGREQEALEFLERFRDLYPRNHRVYARLAEFYLLSQKFEKVREMLNAGLQIRPTDIELLIDQALLHISSRDRTKAKEMLRSIEADEKEEYSRLQGQLFINAALGELDPAFKALMSLAGLHAWPPLMKSLPVFEEMRRDPRFSEFCMKVGLPA